MTDFAALARAYLEQRIEMGEGTAYSDLDSSKVLLTSESAHLLEEKKSAPAANEVKEAQSSWLHGAPEIPGPGLSVATSDVAGWADNAYADLDLAALVTRVSTCEACELCKTRTNTVPGVGNPNADFMIIGEGPGQNEDEQGVPFVGRAGKLLDDIIGAIGLQRPEVYIANMVKCRPPQNRNPKPEEVDACIPYLYRQIQLIEPKVILTVGAVAAGSLLGTKKSLGQMRNCVHDFLGIPLVVTYHPAALLRNPNWKRPTWDDVRIARRILDRDS